MLQFVVIVLLHWPNFHLRQLPSRPNAVPVSFQGIRAPCARYQFIYPDLSRGICRLPLLGSILYLQYCDCKPFHARTFCLVKACVVFPLLSAPLYQRFHVSTFSPFHLSPFPPFHPSPLHLSTPSRQILASSSSSPVYRLSTSPQHRVEVPAHRWGPIYSR